MFLCYSLFFFSSSLQCFNFDSHLSFLFFFFLTFIHRLFSLFTGRPLFLLFFFPLSCYASLLTHIKKTSLFFILFIHRLFFLFRDSFPHFITSFPPLFPCSVSLLTHINNFPFILVSADSYFHSQTVPPFIASFLLLFHAVFPFCLTFRSLYGLLPFLSLRPFTVKSKGAISTQNSLS